MSERRCETCRHWLPGDGKLTPHGECQGIDDELFVKPYRLAVLPAQSNAYGVLFTLPEFHCALWREKA